MIAWLRGAGLIWKLASAGALVAGLVVVYFSWRQHQRMIGYEAALVDVAKQDARARAAADNVLADIDACEQSGGVWNVSIGKCG